MASVRVLARCAARRSVADKLFGPAAATAAAPAVAARLGAARWGSSYFTPAHEYAAVEGKVATCGITDYAQAALGDIVFVDLPEVGDEFAKGEAFGSVESVKAASDVYAPVSGTVVEVNTALSDEPGLVNSAAEGAAWFVKLEMSDQGELGELLSADAYKKHCEKESS